MQRAAFTGLEEVHRRRTLAGPVVESGVQPDLQDSPQLLSGERSERLEGDSEIGAYLKRGVKDRCGPVHVSLRDLPRLGVGDVLVADAGYAHGVLESLPEMETLKVGLKAATKFRNLSKSLSVNGFRLQVGGDFTLEILLGQDNRPVDEIAQDGHQLAVVSLLEILPGEVVILCLGSVGAKHVAKRVLLAGELIDIFIEPDRPVAGGRDFVALKVEELI